jgi:hypothetical protein
MDDQIALNLGQSAAEGEKVQPVESKSELTALGPIGTGKAMLALRGTPLAVVRNHVAYIQGWLGLSCGTTS